MLSNNIFIHIDKQNFETVCKANSNTNFYLVFDNTSKKNFNIKIDLQKRTKINLYCLVLASNNNVNINININHFANDAFSNIQSYVFAKDKSKVCINLCSYSKSKTLKNVINQNINGFILDNDSLIKALPTLDIDTNNIVAKHSVNIGKINPEIVFYLKTKGFNIKQIVNLLISEFFQNMFSFFKSNKKYFSLNEQIKKDLNLFLERF